MDREVTPVIGPHGVARTTCSSGGRRVALVACPPVRDANAEKKTLVDKPPGPPVAFCPLRWEEPTQWALPQNLAIL